MSCLVINTDALRKINIVLIEKKSQISIDFLFWM